MSKKTLYPVQEVSISSSSILFGSIVFAVIFFTIGTLWRYYLVIGV